jgi:hypothetical protein
MVDPILPSVGDPPPKKYALLSRAPKFCGSTTSSRISHKDGTSSSSLGFGMRDISSNSRLPHLRMYPYDTETMKVDKVELKKEVRIHSIVCLCSVKDE